MKKKNRPQRASRHLHLHRLQRVPHWNIPLDLGGVGRIVIEGVGGGSYGHV